MKTLLLALSLAVSALPSKAADLVDLRCYDTFGQVVLEVEKVDIPVIAGGNLMIISSPDSTGKILFNVTNRCYVMPHTTAGELNVEQRKDQGSPAPQG